MNLYKVMIDMNKREFYLIGKTMEGTLTRAQEKYDRSIIGIWLVEKDVS